MTGTVLLEKQDGIAVMTLNRPEAANALSKEMLSDMHEVLSEI
ncbi:MAG: enoyl-CoA hydratase-related protein, partial [Heyndrickxia faecalis]